MNKHTIVTGTSSGIGRAIAERLLEDGHQVLGMSRSGHGIDHANFQLEQLDFSKLRSLENQLPELARKHSDISSIVFCAGYGQFGNLEEFSYRQIQELINTNLLANLYLARAFLPSMKSKKEGNLLFIGSESTLSGGRRGVVYVASKAGLAGAVKALRQECASSGIRVGTVVPGMVKTNFYNKSEFTHGSDSANYIKPQDIAETVSMMLNSRSGTVYDEVRITPLKSVIQRRNR